MGTRSVSAARQMLHTIKRSVRELHLRFRLWKKPKSDCYHCCLLCKWFNVCRWEVEDEDSKEANHENKTN